MRRSIKKKVKPVHISVHPDFFARLENERRFLENKTKKNFTQIQLTEALAKTKINFPSLGRDVFNATKKTRKKG